ncbi:hypothetical protein [Alteraurantiacibacter aquimixticola]|uniref:Uncharacterized protein n=1 Tax=Alteraurantiacibacter aquimixticola TaxID=2489173 RepID=A0A4T3EYY9_9SPHN|nr:hypothetical protein [Alteraurantiacibacter aquimixticola]TIX49751.1 hypothetical protein E5222_13140 [Alteraurantiacibacter aquimixticola]
MKFTPLIAGAGALGLVAGIAGVQAINTTPVTHMESDLLAGLPDHPVAAASTEAHVATPSHYPLETPEGTVPVEDLALHGRYRDSAVRVGLIDAPAGHPAEVEMAEADLMSAEELAERYPRLRLPVAAPAEREILVVGEPAPGVIATRINGAKTITVAGAQPASSGG